MALEELRRIRKEKYTAAGGSVPYNAGFAPGNIYQEIKRYAEETTPDSYTPQQVAQGFGGEQPQIVEERQIQQQAPAVQKSTESPEYQKAKQQLIDLQKQQQQQGVLSRNEVLKQGTGIKDYANGFFNNIVSTVKNVFGINKQPSLSDQMMANEAFRQTYWRQERAIENYADLVLQDKISDKQDYTPADSFIGRTEEGLQNIVPTVIYGVLQPAIGNVARQIGDKTGNQELTYWGEKYGLQTAINFANSKAGQSVASIPSFAQGGYKDPAYYTNAVAQTIGTYGAAIGAGITGYLLSGGNPTVSGYAALSAGFAQESSQMYVSLVDSGTATNKAMDASLLYGAAATYLENAMGFKPTSAISSLFKNGLKKVSINLASKPLYQTALKLAIEEGEEEFLQQLTQNAITKTLNEDQSLTEGLLDSFVQGGLGGALLGGGANVTTKITNKMTNFASKLYNSKNTQATSIKDVQKLYNDYVAMSDKIKDNPTYQDIKQLNIVKEQLLNNSQQFAQPAVDLSVISENTSVKSSIIPLGDKYSYNINMNLGDVSLRENGVETKQVFNTREEASKQLVNRLKQIINTNTVPAMSKVVIEKRIAEYQEANKYADMVSPDYIESTTKDLNKQLKGISNFNQSVAEINRTYRAILDKFDVKINQAFTQKYFKDNANLKTPKQREKYDQVNSLIKEKRVQFEQTAKESFDKLANRAVNYAAKRGYNLSEDQVVSFKSSFMELLAAKKSIDQFGNKGIKELVKTLMNLRQDDFNTTQKKKIDSVYEGEKLKKIELVSDFDSNNPNDPKTQMAQYQYEILQAMEIGEGGYKQFDENGEFVEGVKSSVPEWIPEEYRSTKVIKSVVDHINKGTIPTKVKEIGLYKEVADLFDQEKISLNLQELTEELPPAYVYDDLIKIEKEYDEKINREIEEINNEEISSQVTTEQEQKDVKQQSAIDYLQSKREMFRLATDLDNKQLTTKILKLLGDRETVSKQFVTDLTNKGEIKQVEKDIIRKLLEGESDKINVKEFKEKVVTELLPLTVIKGGESTGINNNFPLEKRYENITLSGDIRGDVKNYDEHLYQSPIVTSAGNIHYNDDAPNYFGHTRIEDMADDVTRRVIEVQSDLYQRGRLEKENKLLDFAKDQNIDNLKGSLKTEAEKRQKELQKLYQYNNPTYSFRLIREELAQASRDGKTKLLLPTGETAMKIEGLGEVDNPWSNKEITKSLEVQDLEIGKEIARDSGNEYWIITDVIGEGKFKAVPKIAYERYTENRNFGEDNIYLFKNKEEFLNKQKETFDISGKVDTNNPIYKFYEKEVAKYVKNNYKAQTITDENGVTWNQINVTPEMGGAVEAFRTGDTIERKTGIKITDKQRTDIEKLNKELFGDSNINFIERLLTPTGQEALGVYRDKMINIVDGKADAKDTFYHEAVHRYMDIFGDMTERAEVLEEVKAKNNLESYNEAEEVLAENFINYAKSREGFVGKIKQFFDNILNKVKVILNKKSTDKIAALYNDILAGKGKDTKQRGFVKSVKNKDQVAEVVKRNLESSYQQLHNPDTIAKALDIIENEPEKSLNRAKFGRDTALNNAIAMELVVGFQEKGNFNQAIELLETLSERATKQGQAIQILSMWGKLSPEGIGKYAQRVLDIANSKLNLTGLKKLKLKPEQLKVLTDMALEIQKMPEGHNKLVKISQMMDMVHTLVPPSIGEKLAYIQTLSQLLNPKTFIRNILGNFGFQQLENLTDVVGTPIDILTSLITKKRSQTLPNISKQYQGFKLGLQQGIQESLAGTNTLGDINQFELKSKKIFVGKIADFFDKALRLELQATDRAFYKGAMEKELNNQLKINKTTVATPEMIAIAHQEGLRQTFQDTNLASKFFTGLKKSLNYAGYKGFGAGELILKYPKTPANILVRAIEYSPVSFINSIFEIGKGLAGKNFNQRNFVKNMSRGIVGTVGLMGLGYNLAALGIITGSADDDKDTRGVQKIMGLGKYKLNISALIRLISTMNINSAKPQSGDTLYSYDWIQPMAIGVSMGANIALNRDSMNSYIETILSSLSEGVNTLAEQPLISGLTGIFKYNDNVMDVVIGTLVSAPSSFVPTALKQVRDLTDNYSRELESKNGLKKMTDSIINKIPYFEKTAPLKYNVFGQPMENYNDKGNSIFNVFINPGFVSKLSDDKVGKEILRIYEASGENIQMPRVVDKSIGGKKLTTQEISDYQKYFGTRAYQEFNKLIDTSDFQKKSDEDKAKIMQGILTDINKEAKEKLFGIKPKEKEKTGGPVFKKTTGSSGPVFKK